MIFLNNTWVKQGYLKRNWKFIEKGLMPKNNLGSKIILNLGKEAGYNLAKTIETAKRKTEQRNVKNLGKERNHEKKKSSSLQLPWAERIRETEKSQNFLVL